MAFKSEEEKAKFFERLRIKERLFKVHQIKLSEEKYEIYIDLESDTLESFKSDLGKVENWKIDRELGRAISDGGGVKRIVLTNTQPFQNYQIRINNPAFHGGRTLQRDHRGAREAVIKLDYNDLGQEWDRDPLDAFNWKPNISIESPEMFCRFRNGNPPPNNRVWCRTGIETDPIGSEMRHLEKELEEIKTFLEKE